MNTDDMLNIFAMRNLRMENHLCEIEKVYRIQLRTESRKTQERDETYYPQFDEDIRNEAEVMADHYEIFYCLEKSIRMLIISRLTEEKGEAWWNQCVPAGIRENVDSNMQREIDGAVTSRSTNEIDYTTFGQLGQIIVSNWDVFGDTFRSKKGVEKILANLNLLRGPIAHCSPLAEQEVVRLKLTLQDWFRQME